MRDHLQNAANSEQYQSNSVNFRHHGAFTLKNFEHQFYSCEAGWRRPSVVSKPRGLLLYCESQSVVPLASRRLTAKY